MPVTGVARAQALGQTMSAAGNIQAAGQNAFRRHASLGAGLHRLPDVFNAGANARGERLRRRLRLGGAQQRALVGEHYAVDRQPVGVRDSNQLGGAAEGKRKSAIGFAHRQMLCFILGDESTADGKESALDENFTLRGKGGESQTVGMLRVRVGRKHLVAMEDEIVRFIEGDRMRSGESDTPRGANGGDRGFDVFRIDGGRFVAHQPEQNRAIGGVAGAG